MAKVFIRQAPGVAGSLNGNIAFGTFTDGSGYVAHIESSDGEATVEFDHQDARRLLDVVPLSVLEDVVEQRARKNQIALQAAQRRAAS